MRFEITKLVVNAFCFCMFLFYFYKFPKYLEVVIDNHIFIIRLRDLCVRWSFFGRCFLNKVREFFSVVSKSTALLPDC